MVGGFDYTTCLKMHKILTMYEDKTECGSGFNRGATFSRNHSCPLLPPLHHLMYVHTKALNTS